VSNVNGGNKRCPSCKNRIVQKSSGGTGNELSLRIDGPIRIDAMGAVLAYCHWCRSEVAIPLELSKSFDLGGEPRVVVLTRAPKTTIVRK